VVEVPPSDPRSRRDSAGPTVVSLVRRHVKAALAVVTTIVTAVIFVWSTSWRAATDYQALKSRVESLQGQVDTLRDDLTGRIESLRAELLVLEQALVVRNRHTPEPSP
jgi:hypothetical protein